MKIFISIFLIFSHLFSTVGYCMETHECGEEMSYVIYGINLSGGCECDHESKEHSKDCCKDKKTVVKAEQKDKQTNNKTLTFKHIINGYQISTGYLFLQLESNILAENTFIFATKHPPNYSPPLYLLYNHLLI